LIRRLEMEDQKAKGEKKTERIRRKAIEILKDHPEGIHYAEWRRRIKAALPEANNNTIGGVIWDLDVKEPELVSKPAPGLFLHDFYQDTVTGGSDVAGETEVVEPRVEAQKRKEQDFYEPFADWLVKELEECTKAIAVGGRLFKDKWGTPDVIGIKEPRRGDLIKLPTEIVSAEIKLDSGSLITAFGQACSYWLFSHKSYIVIPKNSPDNDIARLDALSCMFGIGLILFNPKDPCDPDFRIQARAAKHDPDMFYVNQCMRIVEDQLFN